MAAALTLLVACQVGDSAPALPEQASTFSERAARRAYDGAPPVIPHHDFSADCSSCHASLAIMVVGTGLSPASPHGSTRGMAVARCTQCHVEQTTTGVFRQSGFVGLALDPSSEGGNGIHGDRAYPLSPPRIPHRVFLRENCSACHTGSAARPELRTTHPERVRCQQCHLKISDPGDTFSRTPALSSTGISSD